MMNAIDAYNVLFNHDKDGEVYISRHSNNEIKPIKKDSVMSVEECIRRGLKEEVKSKIKSLIETKDGLSIVNEILIPTLDAVGKDYESGKIFLPQLIQAAEASKEAFEIVQSTFSADDNKKGKFVLCTVEGDVHDIGKNIVKVVCQSYGYEVIDLGKDVKKETVLEAYHKHHPIAIGLSALMTTTVITMKDTIDLFHAEKIDCPILVGGAVLSEEVSKEIKADYYCEDAMATVNILNSL